MGLYTAATVWPQQIYSFQERALSVTDTQTDASNYIRLALWETGLEQIKYQLFQGDPGFWLGSGHDGHESISSSFYERFAPSATIKPGLLLELGAPKNEIVRDFHNMYIQSAVVAGTPWTLGVLIMLVSLVIRAKKSNLDGPARWGSLPTLTCHLVTGITYAILPHFAFLIVIYILSLTFYSE